ncbi:hypothetical protein HPB48_018035 [Haemaphysalis longicornis]|uniref:Serine/threonine-protein phosphatase 4 regulatory subunit 3-like central domain-containing protein n=1 Tax=Haemaphysalis longicornis TaxID=44386 RepID=A0A9J6FHU0_HAELO|nr:hypothetical protein HPB48_018035 [Haemaphysalis longicornis]
MVGLKDDFYNNYIVNGNLTWPLVEAFWKNNCCQNLLDSAGIKMPQFTRVDDVKSLCQHAVEQYGKVLDEVEYVQTFKSPRRCCEQHQERFRNGPGPFKGNILRVAGAGGAGGG